MRLFYAILFNKDFLETLANNQLLLKSHGIEGRYVNKEKLHLTLKFLGEVEEDKLSSLKEITGARKQIPSFCLRLGGLGAFPPKGRPRVLWQGLEGVETEDDKNLKELKDLLENNLEDLGFEKEKRKFKPHITLARDPMNLKRDKLNDISVKKAEIKVNSFSLMSSKLTRNGPIYEEVYRFNLFD